VKGSSASLPYSLQHCEKGDGGRRGWVERAKWTGSIEDHAGYRFALHDAAQPWPDSDAAWQRSIAAALGSAMRAILRDSVFHRTRFTLEVTIEDPGPDR